jgi:hypothetical protein
MDKYTPAREYVYKLIQDELRLMYQKVYMTGFFWGFVTALTGAIAFYLTTGA